MNLVVCGLDFVVKAFNIVDVIHLKVKSVLILSYKVVIYSVNPYNLWLMILS